MKKVILFFDKLSENNAKFLDYLRSSLQPEAQVEAGFFSETEFFISEGKVDVKVNGNDVKDYDLVYFRRSDHSYASLTSVIAITLDKFNVSYFDTCFKKAGGLGNKLTGLAQLASNNLPVPNTYFCFHSEIIKNIKTIVEYCGGFPMIAKNLKDQHMKGVYFVKNEEEIQKLVEDHPDINFLFQEFIDAVEYRLLVLRDEVRVIETKTERNYDFQIKYKDLSESSVFLPLTTLPEEVKNAAIKSASTRSIEIAGVDIMYQEKTGRYWVTEVNRGPGFTYDPKLSPELAAFSDFLKEELKKI